MVVAKQLCVVLVLGGKVRFIGFQIYITLCGKWIFMLCTGRTYISHHFISISMETVFTSQTSLSMIAAWCLS